ncbi:MULTISPECIES: hypothetical protein [Variovorax]|jgi:hypothetical protein|uniref:Lipoprotein n=1 Tax=Variovorax paradoxus (strain EPS) TaxID=595537 RepID=E6VAQ4_VARPE|nr:MULTISPECIES: hypothetical protein [Variovorax]ADU35164.1 hypothetical protein Varpa_0946 [Variovorax paradoxus EPS]MDQ0042244.1 hypothetical protein [Variovorax boronicumulans]
MKKHLHLSIALACALAPAWASACSFAGLEHEVQFAPAITHLESQELISLTNWFVVQRDPNRATGGVYQADIFAGAIKGDAASSQKAQRRLDQIANLLRTLSTTASFEVQTHVEEFERKSIRHPERLDVLNATVQPACAKTGSCCKGSQGPSPQYK